MHAAQRQQTSQHSCSSRQLTRLFCSRCRQHVLHACLASDLCHTSSGAVLCANCRAPAPPVTCSSAPASGLTSPRCCTVTCCARLSMRLGMLLRFYNSRFSPLLGMLLRFCCWLGMLFLPAHGNALLSFDFLVCSLDVPGVDDHAHHLLDVCIECESSFALTVVETPLLLSDLVPALLPREAPAPHPRSPLPSWSLYAYDVLRMPSTPRPRSPLTTFFLVTSSFRARSVLFVSEAHTLTCACFSWEWSSLRRPEATDSVFIARV